MATTETRTGVTPTVWERLAAPFPLKDLEWRILRSGLKDGKPWAMCVPYVTARAIMDRLDAVLGPENWSVSYREWQLGTPGVLATLDVRPPDGAWVSKSDGAEQPREKAKDPDAMLVAVKGGFSVALKRAAVLVGIGRYLYRLEEMFANIHPKGPFRGAVKPKDGTAVVPFRWGPPDLPQWALADEDKLRSRNIPTIKSAPDGYDLPPAEPRGPAPGPQPVTPPDEPQPVPELETPDPELDGGTEPPPPESTPLPPARDDLPTQPQMKLFVNLLQSHHWTDEEKQKAVTWCDGPKCNKHSMKAMLDKMTAILGERGAAEAAAKRGAKLAEAVPEGLAPAATPAPKRKPVATRKAPAKKTAKAKPKAKPKGRR